MPAIDTATPVGTLATQRPAVARVFERLGIDYCCGGKKSLAQTCRDQGLDPAAVVAALDAEADPAAPTADPLAMTLTQLADHIEATHHAYLRQELPALGAALAKLVAAHGPRRPALGALAAVFDAFTGELVQHMLKEERILFPAIRALERAGSGPACGSLDQPIGVMEAEHDRAGAALAEMRRLTDDFTPPPDGCTTYLATFARLEMLEHDVHRHVHKENNVLFPRALELERRRAAG